MFRFYFFLFLLVHPELSGQELYSDFEQVKNIEIILDNPTLDTAASNPLNSNINPSTTCASFSGKNYTEIKMLPLVPINDVSHYSTYIGSVKNISVKFFTDAPKGTKLEIHLGKKDMGGYPEGVHSQYQAVTTKQNAWEEIHFFFAEIPPKSKVSQKEINQITLIIHSEPTKLYKFYIDDIMGPETSLSLRGVEECIKNDFLLFQNYPNPGKGKTFISYDILSAGVEVHLSLMDDAGRTVREYPSQIRLTGRFTEEIDTSELTNGIYFYNLQVGSQSRTKRIIVFR